MSRTSFTSYSSVICATPDCPQAASGDEGLRLIESVEEYDRAMAVLPLQQYKQDSRETGNSEADSDGDAAEGSGRQESCKTVAFCKTAVTAKSTFPRSACFALPPKKAQSERLKRVYVRVLPLPSRPAPRPAVPAASSGTGGWWRPG